MIMELFNYEIQNENEKKLLFFLLILGIFFGFLPFIIAYQNQEKSNLSPTTQQ